MTLNTLPYFLRLTEKYRFPRRVALLPCVSGNKQITAFNKDQAKRDLRLDPAIPVLITIGAEEYYRPGSGYDFFATLQKVLAACGPLQVLVVGPRPEADFVPPALARNARVRLLGPVADPVPFYQAADLCLESFPQPSLGGFVEAVTYGGAFPIPAYAPAESILQIDQPPLPSVSPRTGNEGQYVASIAGRLADLSQTRALARELQTRLLALDREWPALLQGVYSQLDGLCHAPGPIPEGHCSFEQEHRLMAALRPFRLAEEIHARFPYFQGCKLNLQSALQGAGPLGDALRCEWRHLRQGCRRRLGSR